MIIVAVKLFSILVNLGKLVLQMGCSDKIIQSISSTFIHHSCINLQTKTFKFYVRKQNDNVKWRVV